MSSNEIKPPADWDVKQLREIADVTASNVDKKTIAGEIHVRLCNYTDVYENNNVYAHMPFMEATAKQSEIDKFTLRSADIIITKDSETPDDIGVPTVVRENMDGVLCGYHLSLIRPKTNEYDSVFIARQIGSHRIARYFGRQANGSTRFGLNVGPIEATEIWLAPPDEQRRIAEILDTADEAIQKTEVLIAKLKQMKAGLLHDLLTCGIDGDGELRDPKRQPAKFFRDGGRELPVGWRVCTIDELTTKIVDGVHKTPKYVPSGVPFLTVQNLTASEAIDFETKRFVSNADHLLFSKRADPKSGDVLVTKDGTLGVARIVPRNCPDFSIFVSVAQLRPDPKECEPELICEFFNSGQFLRQLGRLSAGTGLKHIHLEHFRAFSVVTPPVEEQREIFKRVSSVTGRIHAEQSMLRMLKQIKSGLMHDLLTGKKRVNQPTHASV